MHRCHHTKEAHFSMFCSPIATNMLFCCEWRAHTENERHDRIDTAMLDASIKSDRGQPAHALLTHVREDKTFLDSIVLI